MKSVVQHQAARLTEVLKILSIAAILFASPSTWSDNVRIHEDWIDDDYLLELNSVARAALRDNKSAGLSGRTGELINGLYSTAKYDLDNKIILVEVFSPLIETLADRVIGGDDAPEKSTVVVEMMKATESTAQRGALLNLSFSSDSPDFLFRLSKEPVPIDVEVRDAVQALFGEGDTPLEDHLYWVLPGRATFRYFGQTINVTAFINRDSLKKKKKNTSERLQVVIANELAHVRLNQRFRKDVSLDWPTASLRKELGLSFEPKSKHIREFFSDVVSVQVNDFALDFHVRRLFADVLKRKDGAVVGIASENYAGSAELLGRAIVSAAEETGGAARRSKALRFIGFAADNHTNVFKREWAALKNDGFTEAVRTHYLELGKQALQVLEAEFNR